MPDGQYTRGLSATPGRPAQERHFQLGDPVCQCVPRFPYLYNGARPTFPQATQRGRGRGVSRS